MSVYELPVKLTKEINKILAEDGLELDYVRAEGDGLYLLKIVQVAPPPLGIHIRDGVGTEDKFGG